MTWYYLALNAVALLAAGWLGWQTRRLRPAAAGLWFVAALALILVRSFLAAHPEYEQHLLWLSDDYLHFASWDALPAVFLAVALGARLRNHCARRIVFLSLLLLSPVFLWSNVVGCLRPDYAMAAQFDANGVCRQATRYSCGPAAAVTLLRLAGIDISEGRMARLCLLKPGEGVTALELCRGLNLALRPFGARAFVHRAAGGGFGDLRAPFLAELVRPGGARHCVVVLELRPAAVLVGDPARGRYACPTGDFLEEWTGVAIAVDPPLARSTPLLSRR